MKSKLRSPHKGHGSNEDDVHQAELLPGEPRGAEEQAALDKLRSLSYKGTDNLTKLFHSIHTREARESQKKKRRSRG